MTSKSYIELTKRHQMMGNEAALAVELLGTGVTKLGEAGPNAKGRYLEAFFMISNGIERTSKIILIADHLIRNGEFLSNNEIKAYGHRLDMLLEKVRGIADFHRVNFKHEFSMCDISKSIIENLSDFSMSSRYYNFSEISSGYVSVDPIERWWREVCVPIIDNHYPASMIENDTNFASKLNEKARHGIFVMGNDEVGEDIRDVGGLLFRNRRAKWVQRWSRMYVLRICRWLSDIVWDLSFEGHARGHDALIGLNEFYAHFNDDDAYFRRRKVWSLYKS